MFTELKLKTAARRVERSKARSQNGKKSRRAAKPNTFQGRIVKIISYPLNKLAAFCKFVWDWIRCIDLIGLVNLTLLVTIIVLFSMLIIDVINCRRNSVVVTEPAMIVENNAPATRMVKTRPIPSPVVRDVKADTAPDQTVQDNKFVAARPASTRTGKRLYGDTIIDGRNMAGMLGHGANIHGNLYLQNMRRYVLPCGIRVDGNLFLRDVNMLQFCGEFTVTGNIYVSPRSSFGPIPRTARLGGYVVL